MSAISSSLSFTPLTFLAGMLWELNSLCSFPLVESIFRGLLQCWSNFYWYGCCFRSDVQSRPQFVWGVRTIFFSHSVMLRVLGSISNFDQPSLIQWCCDSHRQSPFHFSLSHLPTSYLLIVHLFHSFIGAPSNVFNPVLFFDLCSGNFFVIVNFEWHVTVLVIVRCIAFPSALSS